MSTALKAAIALAAVAVGALPAQTAMASAVSSSSIQGSVWSIHQDDESEDNFEDRTEPASEDDEHLEDGDEGEGRHAEHDITAPTTVIKPGTTSISGSDSVTSNLPSTGAGVTSPNSNRGEPQDANTSTLVDPLADSDIDGTATLSLTENEAVVKKLPTADYADPAAEFMAKAYFAVGTLGVGAVALAGNALIRARRLRADGNYDYDYEA